MQEKFKQLLDALDQANEKLASLVDSLDEAPLDWATLEEPIQRRGAQITQLNQAMTASGPVDDSEYKRLLAIHREGERISSSLQAIRSKLIFQTAGLTARHAYRDCLEGMVSSAPAGRVDTA